MAAASSTTAASCVRPDRVPCAVLRQGADRMVLPRLHPHSLSPAKPFFDPDNTQLKRGLATSAPVHSRSGDRTMKKLLISLVFALALAGGVMAALSGIVSASPAPAYSCSTSRC